MAFVIDSRIMKIKPDRNRNGIKEMVKHKIKGELPFIRRGPIAVFYGGEDVKVDDNSDVDSAISQHENMNFSSRAQFFTHRGHNSI